MNVKDATVRIKNHVPQDAANVARTSVDGESQQPIDEASLADARNYLNASKMKDDNFIIGEESEDKHRATVR